MNGPWKSDEPIVPMKSPNKGEQQCASAEGMEGRGEAEGNACRQNVRRTLSLESTQSALARVRQAARADRKRRFTALLHHIYNPVMLAEAYYRTKRKAAPGVDGETWLDYGKRLQENLEDLSTRLKRGAYRAKPVRRAYISKEDGRKRPLGIPVLEDKIVQRATVEVLNAIYETDFLGFSYGFRPKRNTHQALNALSVGIMSRKVNWVLDADIHGFFDSIDHEWLVKFIEHRVADRRVIRLIQKWLSAGVLEEGQVRQNEEGTPQGGSVSPLLANIYLHYALDLWTNWWRKHKAHGSVIVVRYADDFVVGFQYKWEAERYLAELRERFQKFKLELHPEKTRLIEFGRFASDDRKRRGEGKPETFNFLGFTHSCGRTRKGKFTVYRRTMKKRLRSKLKAVKAELKRRMHDAIPRVGQWLGAVVRGHYQYYGVPWNSDALYQFQGQVTLAWYRMLRRRSQKHRMTWERMRTLIQRWIPSPRICRSYPIFTQSGVTT